jgi:hypothetical protein
MGLRPAGGRGQLAALRARPLAGARPAPSEVSPSGSGRIVAVWRSLTASVRQAGKWRSSSAPAVDWVWDQCSREDCGDGLLRG